MAPSASGPSQKPWLVSALVAVALVFGGFLVARGFLATPANAREGHPDTPDTDLTIEVVRPDGKITLQLLGEIQAAGLTPEALSQQIFEGLSKLKKSIDKSEVTVTVNAVNSRKYHIQGEVYKAGQFPLLVPTTVLEALGNAGGFKEFANPKKIVIIRKGGARFNFNYKEVIAGKKLEQNIQLQPGDQIIVR